MIGTLGAAGECLRRLFIEPRAELLNQAVDVRHSEELSEGGTAWS